MADERLRLVAEVADQFTGPLDKLQTALRRTGAAGTQTGKDLKKDFEGFHGVLGKTNSALQSMTAPLSALGVAGLGATLSLTGIATALSGFSKGTQQLSILSKETGLAVDQLRAFGALGERFGVSAETMQTGVKNFSVQMDQLRRRWGQTYGDLQAMNLGDLVEKLVNAPNMQAALDAAMEALTKIGNPVKRREVAEKLFGVDQIGAVAGMVGDKYRVMVDEILKAQGTMTKETEKAASDFEKNMSRMGTAAERLKLNFLGPLLKGLNEVVESGDRAGLKGNAEAMDADLQGRLKGAQSRRDELKGDPVKNAEQLRSLEREIGRLTDAIRRSHEGSGPSGVSAIPMSYSGPIGLGGGLIQKAGFGGFGGGVGAIPPLGGYGSGGGSTGGSYSGNGGVPRGPSSGGGTGTASLPSIPSGPLGGSARGGHDGQFTSAPPEAAGRYRPQRTLTDRDLSDGVVNTIAGEARLHSQGGTDAVINNMFNRLGTKGWGPSHDLHDVARAKGQYAGYRQASEKEANYIRERIRAIASGGVPDNTGGSNSFRASTYRGPWWQRYGRFGKDVAGNTFGFVPGIPNGPYAPYSTPKDVADSAAPLASSSKITADPSIMGLDGQAGVDLGNGTMRMPNGRIRSKTYGSGPGPSADAAGSGGRMGDEMMRRLYGDTAPVAKAPPQEHRMTIDLNGFPPGTRARASMGDLFKETTVSKNRQVEAI